MRELMEEVIKLSKKTDVEFCDIRICENKGASIKIQDGVARELCSAHDYGAAVRVLKNGLWGFASTNNVDKSHLENTLKDAISLTQTKCKKKKFELPELLPNIGVGLSTFVLSPDMVSESEKLKVLSVIEKAGRTYSKKITNTILVYTDNVTKEFLLNSIGSYTEQNLVRASVSLSVTASDGKKKQSMRKRIGSLGGFEIIQNIDIEQFSKETAKKAVSLLKAKEAPSGAMTVITDPDISGLFAHEACGHNTEGDLVAHNLSILNGMKGKMIASEKVTLIDDATIPNRYGTYFYDSEGIPAQKRVLIDKGYFVGCMHNIESAALLGEKPNGSGRAYLHQNIPIVRMSNTYFAPGNATLEDLISDVKFGVLAKGFNWGYVMVEKGQFTCNVQEAWAIRNGKIAEPYGNLSIGGLTLETLKNVEDCTKEFNVDAPGMCGKGQPMWVGAGGPYMKIRNMIVGGYK